LSLLLFVRCAVPFFNESGIRFRDALAALLVFDVGSQCAHSARSDRPFNSVKASVLPPAPYDLAAFLRAARLRSPNTDSLLRLMLTISSASC
jgi:hypothetical protein